MYIFINLDELVDETNHHFRIGRNDDYKLVNLCIIYLNILPTKTSFTLQEIIGICKTPLSFNYRLMSICKLVIHWPTVQFLECPTENLKRLKFHL